MNTVWIALLHTILVPASQHGVCFILQSCQLLFWVFHWYEWHHGPLVHQGQAILVNGYQSSQLGLHFMTTVISKPNRCSPQHLKVAQGCKWGCSKALLHRVLRTSCLAVGRKKSEADETISSSSQSFSYLVGLSLDTLLQSSFGLLIFWWVLHHHVTLLANLCKKWI